MAVNSTKVHHVSAVHAQADYLELVVDGIDYRLAWEDCSPRLASATPEQRVWVEVSPSGYGLHWPLLDEDLALAPLLKQAAKTRQN